MPSLICARCQLRLTNFYSFREKILEADQYFQTLTSKCDRESYQNGPIEMPHEKHIKTEPELNCNDMNWIEESKELNDGELLQFVFYDNSR